MKCCYALLFGIALLGVASGARAQSLFAGTWRPDPMLPAPDEPADEYLLSAGRYHCYTCAPAYEIAADGKDQPVKNPRYDTVSVTVLSGRAVRRVGKRGGKPVVETVATVSADGSTLIEQARVFGLAPHPLKFTSESRRVAGAPSATHPVSGRWQRLQTDLTDHDEDTSYAVKGRSVAMTDRMGRSFTASVDGADAPYRGDPQFDAVSLQLVDDHTLVETDKKGGQAIKTTRWSIDPDGITMRAHFDSQGHIQEQTGHKLRR